MTQAERSVSVAVPKTLLCWVWGWLVGALMATGCALVALDPHRFRWWGVAIFIPPLLSLVAGMIAWSQ